MENLKSITLIKDGKEVEFKLRIFTAKLYSESLKVLRELKQSEFELEALNLALEYEKTKDFNIAKKMVELQNKPIEIENEIHNYLVYCKLLWLNLETKDDFIEDFWLEQDKEMIEQFILFFRKVKKLSRISG
jgi:hypothetical protein